MREKFQPVGEGILVVPIVAITAIVVIAAIGLIFPVVKSNCIVGSGTNVHVDSSWGFNWWGGGFPNPAPDGEGCVRNTPTREALSAIGIWPLGSPEHQIAEKLAE